VQRNFVMQQSEVYWVLGDRYTFHQTTPSLAVIEIESAEGYGPPPHIHEREDESFYVLDGSLDVMVGDKQFRAERGAFVHVPKGTLHTYKTVSSNASRMLVFITPGGFEKLFREIGTPAGAKSAAPGNFSEAVAKLLLLAPNYHLIIPPPSEAK
jgi:quercetin dioxygenase-like cupin family protein